MTGRSSGFNAAERARAREAGPITIVEERTEERDGQVVEVPAVVYHPRRLTNKQLREVRRAARAGTRDADAAAKETEEYQEAYEDALKDGILAESGEPLEGEALETAARKIALEAGYTSDEVGEINNNSLADQLHALLVDGDMQPIPVETLIGHLENDLDSRDVSALMDYLFGADEDPTPATASATS